jgi:hypothetical protein
VTAGAGVLLPEMAPVCAGISLSSPSSLLKVALTIPR